MLVVGANSISKLLWERAKGAFLNPDINFNAAVLAKAWWKINDFSDKTYSTSAMDFGNLLPKMQALAPNKHYQTPNFGGKVVIVTGGASG